MAAIEWEDRFSVGIHEFDEHHKKLIGYINQLHEAMKTGKGSAEIEEILSGLVKYTQFHFAAEEKAMQNYGYTNFVAHKTAHLALTDQVKGYISQMQASKLGLSVQVIQFLKDWLTKHILVEDKQYTTFFNSKGLL